MALILDTDVLTILQRRSSPAYDRLSARLDQQPDVEVCVTIISFQEQVRGWLAELNRARPADRIVTAYAELRTLLLDFCRLTVLPFDRTAQDRFTDLRRQGIRVGTMDLRIACVALTTGYTLLSRNLRDFRKVPGLTVEDWTQ